VGPVAQDYHTTENPPPLYKRVVTDSLPTAEDSTIQLSTQSQQPPTEIRRVRHASKSVTAHPITSASQPACAPIRSQASVLGQHPATQQAHPQQLIRRPHQAHNNTIRQAPSINLLAQDKPKWTAPTPNPLRPNLGEENPCPPRPDPEALNALPSSDSRPSPTFPLITHRPAYLPVDQSHSQPTFWHPPASSGSIAFDQYGSNLGSELISPQPLKPGSKVVVPQLTKHKAILTTLPPPTPS
jgi:hypothetical protein